MTSPSTTSPSGPATFVASGPASPASVALTFHTDGDLDLATQMLDVLAAHGTRMTAFVVGEWLDANPEWAARLIDAGHEVANHTYTHPSFLELDAGAMAAEIGRCRDVIQRLTGSPGAFFRPSGTADGATSPGQEVLALASTLGYPTVLGFDDDPLDYQDPGTDAVVERTLAAAHPGAIVSLHFGHPGTLSALPGILDGLAERGLTATAASTLLDAG